MSVHPMRKAKRQLSREESLDILRQAQFGVLSMITPEGEAYGVPVSYVLLDGNIYFHGAREGRKATCLAQSPRAHFCVVGMNRAAYTHNFTTFYSSVMADGPIESVEGEEKVRALYALAAKYLPEAMSHADHDIQASLDRTAVWALRILDISGKAKKPE